MRVVCIVQPTSVCVVQPAVCLRCALAQSVCVVQPKSVCVVLPTSVCVVGVLAEIARHIEHHGARLPNNDDYLQLQVGHPLVY